MSPATRKITFAISFESLGILLASGFLLLVSDASPSQSLLLSAVNATLALTWNVTFNSVFEYWEARQPIKGRPILLRLIHTALFEGGLTLIMVPLMAWWLDVTLWQAASYEAGLIVLFLIYTYSFTWGFDRLFGLPKSAI
jgi:uncharacterized membrane protein